MGPLNRDAGPASVCWLVLLSTLLSNVALVVAQSHVGADAAYMMADERQSLNPALPSCAADCVMGIVPVTSCTLSPTDCICSNMTLTWEVQGCVAATCTGREAQEAIYIWSSTCDIDSRDAGSHIERVNWSLYACALLFGLARLASRYPFSSKASWDDLAMAACLVALTATTVLSHEMVEAGMGSDFWTVSPENLTRMIFYFYIQAYIYTFVVTFTKVSVLLLYLRLFLVSRARYASYVLLGLVAMFFLSCIFSSAFSCRPVEYNWLSWDGEHEGECFDLTAQFFGLAGANMSLDILIFMLPIYPLWQLRMSWRRRTGIILMFAVGFFVTICSVIRLKTITLFSTTMNITYDYAELNVWSDIEMNVGVMCACMPGVAAFIKRMFPRQVAFLAAKCSPKNSRAGAAASGDEGFEFNVPNASRTVGGSTVVDHGRSPSGDEAGLRPPGRAVIKKTTEVDIDISYHHCISSLTPSTTNTITPRSGSATATPTAGEDDEEELLERMERGLSGVYRERRDTHHAGYYTPEMINYVYGTGSSKSLEDC